LVPIEVHYMEKNPGMFSSKNFFSTEERKTLTSWMTWGWVNYQQKLFQKWTTPLSLREVMFVTLRKPVRFGLFM